jgi:hypothetical protein
LIALFGVAMLNGVVLVSSINGLRAAGATTHEAVVRGGRPPWRVDVDPSGGAPRRPLSRRRYAAGPCDQNVTPACT